MGFAISTVTLVSDVAPQNALPPMLVTPAGIVTLVSDVVPWNAYSPMLVTLAGIATLVSDVAPQNALSPMLVTLAGITTEPTQLLPKVTTPLVIVKFGIELDGDPVVHRYVPFEIFAVTINRFQVCPIVAKPVAVDVT